MLKQTEGQRTGREGERWFHNALPTNWILQPPLDDVGADGVVVICEDGPLNGTEFRIQVKSSKQWPIRDGMCCIRGVSRDAVMYWLTGFTPTLLVLYESTTKRGYCEWVNRLAAGKGFHLGRGKTVSLKVPARQEIGASVWAQLRNDLRAMNGLITRRVLSAGKALPLLRALHALADALHGIDFAANATKDGRPPSAPDDLSVLCQLEVSCHRDVVRAMRALHEDLKESGYSIEGLSQFAEAYADRCSSFISAFPDIVENPSALRTIQVNSTELASRRAGFNRSVVEAMRQLTSIGLQIVPESSDDNETEAG